MADKKLYYFEDTRDNAKQTEPFAIENPDVAKSWVRDFNTGEGPFKPVDEPITDKGAGVVTNEADFNPDFQVNRRDLQEAGVNETPVQEAATKHNLEVLNVTSDSRYDGAEKVELQNELTARNIPFKKSGPESTNEFLIAQLVKSDNE